MTFAQRKVLVLNKRWTAIGVISLPRAIVMLFSCDPKTNEPKAEVVDDDCVSWIWDKWKYKSLADGEDGIKTCRGSFKIPEVIKLSKYDRLPQHKIHFSRRSIHKRDGSQCQYCGKRGADTIDHVIPKCAGGQTTWDNCVLACVECNTKKANKIPERIRLSEQITDTTGNTKNVYVSAFTVFFNDKSMPHKILKQPRRPEDNTFGGELIYRSWQQWLESN